MFITFRLKKKIGKENERTNEGKEGNNTFTHFYSHSDISTDVLPV